MRMHRHPTQMQSYSIQKKGHVKGKDKVHVADTPMYISKRKGVYEPYNTSTLSSSLVLQQTESEGL